MRNRIELFDCRSYLHQEADVKTIGDDFMLFESFKMSPVLNRPFKVDTLTTIICIEGECHGKIDLISYHLESSSMTILMPNTILEYESVSSDFKGLFLIMSVHFLESLNIGEWVSSYANVRDNPYVKFNREALDAIVNYYRMCEGLLLVPDHPYRMEALKNLTRAFFYGAGYYFHDLPKEKSREHYLLERFLKAVKLHYREERSVEFYANELSLTSKYMSSKIKESCGKTASELIDEYIILEAKELLRHSNMNVQQISDYLNFPSQSFFGKYFKRIVGLSPKAYKNGIEQ